MKKDEIVKAVRDYVNNDKVKYAVLITGGWGTGKTYFYEHDLKTEILLTENGKNNGKANVYISLYGISSIEQLSKEIVINYLIRVKLHSSQKGSKVYRQIGNIISVCSKMFSFSFNGLSADFEKGIKELEGGIDFKDMIICLDDFERCNIPMNEIFGMINNLVEHCNCKVIILADEDNIGKMHANTNIEMKYLTLLTGRKLDINDTPNKCVENDKQSITIETLKKLNNNLYSDNYIYSNIKEKVIGLTLKYESNVKDDFKSIVESVINSKGLSEKLLEDKEDILKFMDKCKISNIRTMKMWLLNFEKIYNVLTKYINNSDDKKYFNEVYDRFALYSIRVAGALEKSNSLYKWEKGKEIGYINLGGDDLMEVQGYKFVDDLFKDSVLSEQKIFKAAKFIIQKRKEEEQWDIDQHRRKAYEKLILRMYYLEDEDIDDCIIKMKEEIERDDFTPQNYQSIIFILVLLEQEGCIDENCINEICVILKSKLENMRGKIEIEDIQFDSLSDKSKNLFHKFYNPLYLIIAEKNQQVEKLDKERAFSFSDGAKFLHLCTNPPVEYIGNEVFISDFDLKKLVEVIQTGDIEGIYHIAKGIEKLGFKTGELEVFKKLVIELNEKNFIGRMRNRAVKHLIEEIHKKTNIITNADKDDVNN